MPDAPPATQLHPDDRTLAPEAHLDQCDLIMKGGITSGVIYPLAIAELSHKYRFRLIGGSSAGAIAAVLTAAAEYGRWNPADTSPGDTTPLLVGHGAPAAGAAVAGAAPAAGPAAAALGPGAQVGAERYYPAPYDRVAGIPDALASADQLTALFQPAKKTKAVFKFALIWLEKRTSLPRKVAGSVWNIVASSPLWFLGVTLLLLVSPFMVGMALTDGLRPVRVLASLLVWLPGAMLCGLMVAAVRTALGAHRLIVENNYGIALGHSEESPPAPTTTQAGGVPGGSSDAAASEGLALTDWLDAQIQSLAGRSASDPLTYGDLWTAFPTREPGQAPGGAAPAGVFLGDHQIGAVEPAIDLKVMTTCVTQGLPYTFPFVDADAFAFCPACWQRLFPTSVLGAMVDRSPGAPAWGGAAPLCPRDSTPLLRLPPASAIPIVVGARLSLSFPVLISAVPLCYLDSAKCTPDVVLAWFSDGGITSNFPMHFFDTPLPDRPTFGINLDAVNPAYGVQSVALGGERVCPAPTGGAVASASAPASSLRLPRERKIGGLVGFLTAIGLTMQGWSDTQQAAAPGFRDRIVEAYLTPEVGGLNLKMSEKQIRALSKLGRDAGTEARDKFDFRLHRWRRFRIAMNGWSVLLDEHGQKLSAFTEAVPPSWSCPGPPPPPPEISDDDRLPDDTQVRAEAEQLKTLAEEWAGAGYPATYNAPQPESLFRLAPRR